MCSCHTDEYIPSSRQTGCSGCPAIASHSECTHMHAWIQLRAENLRAPEMDFLTLCARGCERGGNGHLSRHRYAGLIVPQMSVQVVWGGGGNGFPSPLLCCSAVHWASSQPRSVFHKGHFTNNQASVLHCTFNCQRTLQGIKLLSLFSWVL